MLSSATNTDCFREDLPSLRALVREQQSHITALREELRIEKLNAALQGQLFGTASVLEESCGSAREALKRSRKAVQRVYEGARWRVSPENLPALATVRLDLPEDQRTGLVWMRDEISYE